MNNLINKAINLIEANRISSTEVADVLGKKGQINNVYPLNRSHFKVGEVVFVYAINNSNYELHKQIAELDLTDKILFVYNVNCDRAIFGDLVTKYIMLYKRAKAIVVTGKLRDAHTLIKENYPIWCETVSPIGCVNYINGEDIDVDLYNELYEQYNGAIMVCDDSGVVMIPKTELNEQLMKKLEFIEFQEDIWFYCLDTLKMSTFEIVCQKKYLTEDLLDKRLLEKLEEFQSGK